MMRVHSKDFIKRYLFIILLGLSWFAASPCTAQGKDDAENQAIWYKPAILTKWHIQLQGSVAPDDKVDLHDIDLFNSPASLIQKLHSSGKHVICYFSAGSSENWRPDYSKFIATEQGKDLVGWPGEKWLDIRSRNVREIMLARMDMAKQNGCDGVDPDNVEGYANKTGFPLTAADQIDYNSFLANEAHKRGLAVGLKNDLGQVGNLVNLFDFSVNEECFQYQECDKLTPFISSGKPVLNIEYQKKYVNDVSQRQMLCKTSLHMKFSTLILPLKLDNKFGYSCL